MHIKNVGILWNLLITLSDTWKNSQFRIRNSGNFNINKCAILEKSEEFWNAYVLVGAKEIVYTCET